MISRQTAVWRARKSSGHSTYLTCIAQHLLPKRKATARLEVCLDEFVDSKHPAKWFILLLTGAMQLREGLTLYLDGSQRPGRLTSV